jgi:signal transduction histidine kinase/ligand-binding sensor domain-containing protein
MAMPGAAGRKNNDAEGRGILRLALLLAFASLLLTCVAEAIPAHYSIAQLYHTQWIVQQGAPTGIQSMAQTNDGFIWIAADRGLFRFDGVQFELFNSAGGVSLPSRDAFTLFATREGGLWIGYRTGGASYLLNGRLVNYGESAGLPVASVSAFASPAGGTAWLGTSRGLFRLEGGHWRLTGADWNLPERFIYAVMEDRDHILWVLSESKVFYLQPGARRFEQLPVVFAQELQSASLILRRDGVAAICTRENFGVLKLAVPSDSVPYIPDWNHRQGMPGDLGACVYDRDDHLWVGSIDGVSRFPSERAPAKEGQDDLAFYKAGLTALTGTVVSGALEDLEGNIWISTNNGLDQFRAPALSKLPMAAGTFAFGLAPAGTRGMWIATNGGYTYRVYRGEIIEQFKRELPAAYDLSALSSDRSGELWVGFNDEIRHRAKSGHWESSVRPPVSTGHDYDNIQAITADVQGVTWVSVPRVGVYRVTGQQWTLTPPRIDNPSDTAITLFADTQDRVWVGYTDGTVIVHEGGVPRTVVDRSHTPLGAVYTFAQRHDTILIGSERGLWRTDGKSISAVGGGHSPFAIVTGIVSTGSGDVWLNTADGLAWIEASQFAQSFEHSDHPLRYRKLDYLDGLPGNSTAARPHPKAAADSDGRIWFAGADGVAWIDPTHLLRNDVVPRVILRSMIADGIAYALDFNAPVTLPKRVRNLQISYTAPSLTIPERVAFRYRLVDEDRGWLDAGSRREAFFTDLPPGQHRFQVIAANNDGLWNETGASITFFIPPTFVQTIWFKALCVSAAGLAIWFLFQLRLRSIKSRMRLRMDEREHIARELHDTFLQAVQGLMLRFQSAMERIPPHEPSRAMMEDALDRADRVIEGGREAVSSLRSAPGPSIDLAGELREAADRLSQGCGSQFAFVEEGVPRQLSPDIQQNVQRIATEALANAFRHSQSAIVELKVSYSRASFSLQVSDAGRGFDPEAAHAGHWGIVGMRERAARIRGHLLVDSGPRGTTVRLEVPARVAYVIAHRGSLFHRLIN